LEQDYILIHWFKDPDCTGPYRTNHHLLEVLEENNESR
jgi:hypothetical protein